MTMAQNFAQKVVVVAGASSGMGRATARAVAAVGAKVVLAARNTDALARLCADIEQSMGHALAIPFDATDRASTSQLVDRTMAAYGRVDIVVNSVGTNIARRTLDELTADTWSDMLDVNLTAAFNITRAFLPVFRARREGLLIHIASVAAKKPDRSGVAYQATKAGVVALTHATMEEERANGIRATAILPGLTDTPLMLKRPTPTLPEVLAKALQPEDVAAACLFVMQLPARAHVSELVIGPSQL